jgi:hypothetical protein
LIEESRTNVAVRSEEFDNASWGNGSVTRTANQIVSPSGATDADLITSVAGNFGGKLAQNFTFLTTTYTASVFVKKGNWRYVGIQLADVSSSAVIPSFDFDTETVSQNGTSFSTLSVQKLANGWYRLSLTQAVTAISSTFAIWLTASNGNVTGPINVGNTLYTWGAQLEAGVFPTSYIPTTTASVVRSADVCSISGSNFTGFWNQSAGTLVETFEASPNTNTTYVSASNGNIVQNSLHLDNDTGLMRAVYYSGSSLVATLDLGSVGTVGTVNTIATAYSVNDFAASRNGGTVVTDTSGAVPASLSQINIGTDERSQTPTSFYSNRCIKSLRYYKKRLANAKLQTLST